MKAYVNILASLRKLAQLCNVTMIYLSVEYRFLMKNVDFSNRQRLQSASEIIYKVHILKLYDVERTHNLLIVTASLPNIILQRVDDKLMD